MSIILSRIPMNIAGSCTAFTFNTERVGMNLNFHRVEFSIEIISVKNKDFFIVAGVDFEIENADILFYNFHFQEEVSAYLRGKGLDFLAINILNSSGYFNEFSFSRQSQTGSYHTINFLKHTGIYDETAKDYSLTKEVE